MSVTRPKVAPAEPDVTPIDMFWAGWKLMSYAILSCWGWA